MPLWEKAFLYENPPKSVFASYLIRIILSTKISAKYVEYFFKSRLYWRQIRSKSVGIAQPNFNANKLSNIQILLPSFNEQKRIVAKIESIFARIDATDKLVRDSLTHLDLLKKSVLKKAFEGRLVPQDSKDEPAEILLQRIKRDKQLKQKPMRTRIVK